MKKEKTQIAEYFIYYAKQGTPIRKKDGEIIEIPITVDKIFIKPELKESWKIFFKGLRGSLPTEIQINEWIKRTKS